MDPSQLTIIIPTLNEEQNIGRLIDTIQQILPKSFILVVDDGSKDKTPEIVKSKNGNVKLLDRSDEPIKGLSASVRDGIHMCETPYFMVIDGDFQHPPESLLDAMKCFDKDADLVIGYRIKVEDWPFNRKLISWGAQILAHMALLIRRRQRPKDLMSGFFGGKKEVIDPLIETHKIALKGYKILFDILKVFPRDGKIEQFGYVFKNREYGASKIGKTHIIEFLKSLI